MNAIALSSVAIVCVIAAYFARGDLAFFCMALAFLSVLGACAA